MRFFVIPMMLVMVVFGALYDIRTNSLDGRIAMEYGDTIILHPKHSLVGHIPRKINVVLCETISCREATMRRLRHKYRTNGIVFEVIK